MLWRKMLWRKRSFWSGACPVAGLALAVALLGSLSEAPPARAQAADTTAADTTAAPVAVADTLAPGHPNRTPYRSDRSLGAHVLAAPSYLLHWATRPLGWAVKEAEERFPEVFEGHLPPYGLYPIFELGGESDFAGGVVAFYHDLPWGGHSADVRFLFGSSAYNRAALTYRIPAAFGGDTALEARARYFNDPSEQFYLGGNDARRDDDEAAYATRQVEAEVSADADFSSRVEGDLSARFQRATIDPDDDDDDDDERPLPAGLAGVGSASLLSAEAAVTFDLTSQQERSVEGSRLRFAAAYGQSLDSERFRFGRYEAELVQFVPVPLLPSKRRLALRGLLEKTEPFGDREVPFYRLPSLGGTRRLRGYSTDRFQEEGALTLTAEYRWPVWDFLDAVLFAEAGQVFADYDDLALGRFHAGYGGGIHLVTGGTLAFRLELASAGEGLRTILTVEPAF